MINTTEKTAVADFDLQSIWTGVKLKAFKSRIIVDFK